ncbi:MAG TPA: T9SS type A sorting domain-containing protein [Ferruginibacter sp.]|nr:T9SS type A sorting domain-containing protein [Ferruginibacter sp.]HMP21011.1 T9SS type A sorting domain-containing protein [Ferruginibacter sp.]
MKKIFTILTVVLLTAGTASAQLRTSTQADFVARVVKYYPNPASDVVNFELQPGIDKSYSLQLFNFMGRKVFETNPNSQRLIIPLDGFFRGVYIYQLRDKSGRILDSGKFQVVK